MVTDLLVWWSQIPSALFRAVNDNYLQSNPEKSQAGAGHVQTSHYDKLILTVAFNKLILTIAVDL